MFPWNWTINWHHNEKCFVEQTDGPTPQHNQFPYPRVCDQREWLLPGHQSLQGGHRPQHWTGNISWIKTTTRIHSMWAFHSFPTYQLRASLVVGVLFCRPAPSVAGCSSIPSFLLLLWQIPSNISNANKLLSNWQANIIQHFHQTELKPVHIYFLKDFCCWHHSFFSNFTWA
jgi:hypothetical protein